MQFCIILIILPKEVDRRRAKHKKRVQAWQKRRSQQKNGNRAHPQTRTDFGSDEKESSVTRLGLEPRPSQTQLMRGAFSSSQTMRKPRQARFPHIIAGTPEGRAPAFSVRRWVRHVFSGALNFCMIRKIANNLYMTSRGGCHLSALFNLPNWPLARSCTTRPKHREHGAPRRPVHSPVDVKSPLAAPRSRRIQLGSKFRTSSSRQASVHGHPLQPLVVLYQ